VLRVRKYLNELLLDQLPVLADVQVCAPIRRDWVSVFVVAHAHALASQRYMDELTVMEAPAPTAQSRGFVLEVEPEIRTALLRDANWDEIAAYQLAKIPKAQNDREITKCVASTRNKHTHKCPVGGSHFTVCFVVQTGRRVRE